MSVSRQRGFLSQGTSEFAEPRIADTSKEQRFILQCPGGILVFMPVNHFMQADQMSSYAEMKGAPCPLSPS